MLQAIDHELLITTENDRGLSRYEKIDEALWQSVLICLHLNCAGIAKCYSTFAYSNEISLQIIIQRSVCVLLKIILRITEWRRVIFGMTAYISQQYLESLTQFGLTINQVEILITISLYLNNRLLSDGYLTSNLPKRRFEAVDIISLRL